MTITKHFHQNAPSAPLSDKPKLLPKRAVSFGQSFKFAPSTPINSPSHSVKGRNDSAGLQGDKRRKYMRRGSKTPAMLLMTAKADFDAFVQDLPLLPCAFESVQEEGASIQLQPIRRLMPASISFPTFIGHQPMKKDNSSFETSSLTDGLRTVSATPKDRRLSMMSTLKQSFESTSISAKTATKASTYRRLSLEMVR